MPSVDEARNEHCTVYDVSGVPTVLINRRQTRSDCKVTGDGRKPSGISWSSRCDSAENTKLIIYTLHDKFHTRCIYIYIYIYIHMHESRQHI